MFRRPFALCILILSAALAFAQAEVPAAGSALEAMSELERKTLSLDIAVSNYYELRDMAVQYGLSTDGGSDELRSRLYAYLNLDPPANPSPASSVSIEGASGLEYFTLEGLEDRLIRLKGPVTLTISTEDGFSHKLLADEIVFDRDKNIVEAKGSVKYVREGAGRSDEFRGSTILVDLNAYSGVFVDGAYNLEPSASTQRSLTFHFGKLTRRGPDLTLLENADVTACDEAEPHYHIRAKKVWLFGNGDWALSAATLYVGIVPVLWVPFFYYPNDEILFHPVVGYRSREGAFVQTTTYLLGERKKDAKTSSSLSLFSQQTSGGASELSGIFIRRLQSDGTGASSSKGAGKGAQADSRGRTLKLLADVYAALGAYVGLAGTDPSVGGVSTARAQAQPSSGTGSLSFSLGFGASRSLFLESNGYYSPFDYSNDYASVWNSIYFLGLELPVRFGMNLSFSYKKASGPLQYSLALEMPLYSDPYFEQDFYQRNEASSILSMFDANTTTISKRTSMTQSLLTTLSWARPITGGYSLLESAALSRLAAQMTWKTKSQPTSSLTTAEKRLLAVNPQRDFFYPDTFKPLDTSFSLSGTMIDFDSSAKKKGGAAGGAKEAGAAEPAETAASGQVSASDQPAEADQPAVSVQGEVSGQDAVSGPVARDFSQVDAKVGWSASGSANVEEKFYSSSWTYPADVDTALSYLLLGGKGGAKVSATADWAERLLSMQTSLGFSAQDQWRPYLKDDRTSPTTVHPYRLADYAYRSASVDAAADLVLSPFSTYSSWAASSLKYSIGGTIYKYAYAGLSGSGVDATPIYDTTWIGWDSDTFSTHGLTATFSLAPKKSASQTLSFQTSLPPLLEKYSATYSFTQKYVRATLYGSVEKETSEAALLPSSLTAQLSLGASPWPTLKSSFSWDFDASAPLSSVTSLEYGGAKAAFTAKKSKGYVFSDGLWSADGSEYFRPYEASFTLAPRIGNASKTAGSGTTNAGAAGSADGAAAETLNAPTPAETGNVSDLKLKLNFQPSISYTQNLVRFTESTLGANFDFSLTSAQGTSLTFSSVSANKSAWRYWPSLFPSTSDFDPTEYYRNFFVDLGDSLSIWDTSKLKYSLFKLQSLSLKLSQDLHDWNLAASLGMSPVLVTPDAGRPYYQLDFSFSLSVTWKDIPELKASVDYEDGAFTD